LLGNGNQYSLSENNINIKDKVCVLLHGTLYWQHVQINIYLGESLIRCFVHFVLYLVMAKIERIKNRKDLDSIFL
jgi:hypothetical protein